MNEPANFLAGSPSGCQNNRWNNPPFVRKFRNFENNYIIIYYHYLTYSALEDKNINTKTVCMDAEEFGGRHYDLHSLYGHLESIATNM